MDTPLVSFVIPLYNAATLIEKTLSSLVSIPLDPEEYEIIVVNDGSKDNSSAVVKQFSEDHSLHSIWLIEQENKGCGGARNTGISYARGAYLWFIDADDTVEPAAVSHLACLLRKHTPDLLSIGFDFVYAAEVSHRFPEAPILPIEGLINVWTALEEHPYLLQMHTAWRNIYRRELVVGNRLAFPEHLYYEDFPFFLDVLGVMEPDRFVHTNTVGYYYFINQDSITQNPNPAKQEKRLHDRIQISLWGLQKAQAIPCTGVQDMVQDLCNNYLLFSYLLAAQQFSYKKFRHLCSKFPRSAFAEIRGKLPLRRRVATFLLQYTPTLFWAICRTIVPTKSEQ